MSEELLVHHCAPTLAGLKSGNLFSCICQSLYEAHKVVAIWNNTLNQKGVKATILNCANNRVLIYVYRPAKLLQELSHSATKKFLRKCGYIDLNLDNMLKVLASRIKGSDQFPHEIGLFLGYPLEDVRGFIDNKGRNSHMTGYWKVYSNPATAAKTFKRFNKCITIYTQKIQDGTSLDRLTVKGAYA